MIYEKLQRFPRTFAANAAMMKAYDFLVQGGFENLSPQRIIIDGEKIYAMVQEYETKPVENGVWEAHRRYIDIQYLLLGAEIIFYAPIESLKAGEYVAEKDFLPLQGKGMPLLLQSGFFTVFFPEDAHMPGLVATVSAPVKKVVVKVLLEEFLR